MFFLWNHQALIRDKNEREKQSEIELFARGMKVVRSSPAVSPWGIIQAVPATIDLHTSPDTSRAIHDNLSRAKRKKVDS